MSLLSRGASYCRPACLPVRVLLWGVLHPRTRHWLLARRAASVPLPCARGGAAPRAALGSCECVPTRVATPRPAPHRTRDRPLRSPGARRATDDGARERSASAECAGATRPMEAERGTPPRARRVAGIV